MKVIKITENAYDFLEILSLKLEKPISEIASSLILLKNSDYELVEVGTKKVYDIVKK